jgi:hypothetical protein
MTNEQVSSESQSVLRELSVAELDAVSGANLAKGFPDPIPNPSPTFPSV